MQRPSVRQDLIDRTVRDEGGHMVPSLRWRPILTGLTVTALIGLWLTWATRDPSVGALFVMGALALVPFFRPKVGALILAGMPRVSDREGAALRRHARASQVWFLSIGVACLTAPLAVLQHSYAVWMVAWTVMVAVLTAWVILTLEPLARASVEAPDESAFRRVVRRPFGAMCVGYGIGVLFFALLPAVDHLLHATAWQNGDSTFAVVFGWVGALTGVSLWEAHVGDPARTATFAQKAK